MPTPPPMVQDHTATPVIIFTPEAAAAARRLGATVDAYRDLPLRLYIDGKGCDGFYYGVSFDQQGERDIAFSSDGLRLIIDPESLTFMNGSEVSWINDERGEGFLVENPQQRRFRGKFFRRQAWVEKLTPGVGDGAASLVAPAAAGTES